jgi:hypothetical protein
MASGERSTRVVSDPINRRLVGYLLLLGAVVMGVLAVLFHTEVIADPGVPRNTISLILGGVAAADAAIGLVLIARA